MTFYDFTVKNRDGSEQSLAAYKGKVVLVVNTAIECGLTPQYAGLQKLYDDYHDKGLEILDFPCDQFGHQAPGTNDEIHTFCTGRFGITFPQFGKIDVNGENADPLYVWLKEQRGGIFGDDIKWNFGKFLLNREGEVVDRFAPTTTPEAIVKDIEKLL